MNTEKIVLPRLTRSAALFHLKTETDPATLTIQKYTPEWFSFVKVRNQQKWNSTEMQEAGWKAATNLFNSRLPTHESGHDPDQVLTRKTISAVKACLRSLEVDVASRLANNNYSGALPYTRLRLLNADIHAVHPAIKNGEKTHSVWWKTACDAVPGFGIVCTLLAILGCHLIPPLIVFIL